MGTPLASVVAIPDADQTPEQIVGLAPGVPAESQFARRLAENGCRVIVPVLIDRKPTTWEGTVGKRVTNIPHREFIWRMAYEMGRHPIGYEVQKVLAAIDWFEANPTQNGRESAIGIYGYGEGGLIALYAGILTRESMRPSPAALGTARANVPGKSRSTAASGRRSPNSAMSICESFLAPDEASFMNTRIRPSSKSPIRLATGNKPPAVVCF